MHHLIDEYLNYLSVEKGASRNTIDGYSRDLNRYAAFIGDLGIQDIGKIGTEELISYLASPERRGACRKQCKSRTGCTPRVL